MKVLLTIITSSILTIGLYTGCGGSKSSGEASSNTGTQVKAIDGYIYNAKVISTYRLFNKKTGKKFKDVKVLVSQDLTKTVMFNKDGNKTIPGGEFYRVEASAKDFKKAMTDAGYDPSIHSRVLWHYEISPYKQSRRGTKDMYLPSFIDINKNGKYDEGEEFDKKFSAFAGSKIVTPLTNFLHKAIGDIETNSSNPDVISKSIEKKVLSAARIMGRKLGIKASDVLSYDPVGAINDENGVAYGTLTPILASIQSDDDIKRVGAKFIEELSEKEKELLPDNNLDDNPTKLKKAIALINNIVQENVKDADTASTIKKVFATLAIKAQDENFLSDIKNMNLDETRERSIKTGDLITISNQISINSDINISSVKIGDIDLSKVRYSTGDKFSKVVSDLNPTFMYQVAKDDINKSLDFVFSIAYSKLNNFDEDKNFLHSSLSIKLPILMSKNAISVNPNGQVHIAMTDKNGLSRTRFVNIKDKKSQETRAHSKSDFTKVTSGKDKTIKIRELIYQALKFETMMYPSMPASTSEVLITDINIFNSNNGKFFVNPKLKKGIAKIQMALVPAPKTKLLFVKQIGADLIPIQVSSISIKHKGNFFSYIGNEILNIDKTDLRGDKIAKNKGVKLSALIGDVAIDMYKNGVKEAIPTKKIADVYRINLPQNIKGVEYNISDINVTTTEGEIFEYYKLAFYKLPKGIINLSKTTQTWSKGLTTALKADFGGGATLKIPVSALKFEDDKNTTLNIAIKVFEEFGLDEVNKTALSFIFNRPLVALKSDFLVKTTTRGDTQFSGVVDAGNDINLTWNNQRKQFDLSIAEKEFNSSYTTVGIDGNGTVLFLLQDKDAQKNGKIESMIKKVESLVGNKNKGINDVNGSVIPVTQKPFKIEFNITEHLGVPGEANVGISFETDGAHNNGKLPLRITFDGNATAGFGTVAVGAEKNNTANHKHRFPVRVTFADEQGAESFYDFNITLARPTN